MIQRDVNPENDKTLDKMLDAKFGGRSKTLVKGSTVRTLDALLKRAITIRKQFEDRIFDPRREAPTEKEVQEPADHITLPGRDKTNPAYKRGMTKGKITHTEAYSRVKGKPGVKTPHALAQHIVEQAGGEPKKLFKIDKHGQHDQTTHGKGRGGGARRRPETKSPKPRSDWKPDFPTTDTGRVKSFASKYPKGWHGYAQDKRTIRAVEEAASTGHIEISRDTNQFRLTRKVTKSAVDKHAQHDQSTHGRKGPASRAPAKVRVRVAGHKLREAGEAISPRATRAAEGKLRTLGQKLNPKVLIPQIDSVLDDIDAGGRIARRLREIKSDLTGLFQAVFPEEREKMTKAMLNAQLEKGISHSLKLLTDALTFIGDQSADSKISEADDKKLGELIDEINGMVGYLKDVKEQGFFEKAVVKHGSHDQSSHGGGRSSVPKEYRTTIRGRRHELRRNPKTGGTELVPSEKKPRQGEKARVQLRLGEGGVWRGLSQLNARQREFLRRSINRLNIQEEQEKVTKRTVDKHGSHDQSSHSPTGTPGGAKQLRRVSHPRPQNLRINADVNRAAASKALKSGMTTKDVARAWPAVWQLDSEGKLGQKYDMEYSDGVKDTDRHITAESLKSAIVRSKKKKVSKGEPNVPDSATTYRPSFTTPAVAEELKRQGIKPNAKGRGASTARVPGY